MVFNPALEACLRRLWSKQHTLKWLLKKRPFHWETTLAAHHDRIGLGGTLLPNTLIEPMRISNQATAAVGTEGTGADQACISPGKSFLEHLAVTRAAQLGSSTTGRSQSSIQADGQNQP